MPPKTEFVSFLVKAGMESEANAWIDALTKRQAECVESLDRERMHYESIFKSVRGGRLYLSWFSVQGANGAHVHSSPHEIDRLHVEYWEKCIDRSSPPEVFEHLVSFVPSSVAQAVADRDAV
jgi:hypothetical protein